MQNPENQSFKIGMLLFPDLTQLDLTAPYEVFTRMPNAEIYLIWENLEPVKSEKGMAILPNQTFQDCPDLDILFVPGGPGVNQMIENELVINFLKKQAQTAQYITSVCTGSLILAVAGLLDGYEATTHWLSLSLLRMFPKIKVKEERVVIDRNRVTGGGVTAGIDFALTLAAQIYSEELAQLIQLNIEYNPQPPYTTGSPKTASSELIARIEKISQSRQEKRKELLEKIIHKA